jgi:hypothetical protein
MFIQYLFVVRVGSKHIIIATGLGKHLLEVRLAVENKIHAASEKASHYFEGQKQEVSRDTPIRCSVNLGHVLERQGSLALVALEARLVVCVWHMDGDGRVG